MERTIEREVESHRNEVRSLFLRRGVPYHDVEDLTQEVLLAYTKRLRLQAKGDLEALKCPRAFVTQIAKNKLCNWIDYRSNGGGLVSLDAETTASGQHRSADTRPEQASQEPDPQQIMLSRENREFIRKCLAELPEQKRAIMLLGSSELPQAEAAQILGMSHANFRQHLSRTRKELMKIFSDWK